MEQGQGQEQGGGWVTVAGAVAGIAIVVFWGWVLWGQAVVTRPLTGT